jgi:peptidoglycan/LPS O-acetylase OafA/YrhL
MVRRIFRMYPLSISIALVSFAIMSGYYFLNGIENPMSLSAALSTGLLVENYTHTFVTNPVVWTLEVEVLFYALMSIIAATVGRIERTTYSGSR